MTTTSLPEPSTGGSSAISRPQLILYVDDVIAAQRVRASTLLALAVLTMALISDGFDIQLLSFSASGILHDWHVTPASLAPLFSANLVGMVIGATLFGKLGDRIGRRPIVTGGTAFCGCATLLCLTSHTLGQLAFWRFLTGVGLGGVMPNVIALAVEISPVAWRTVTGSLVLTGMFLGSIASALAAKELLPLHGWKSLFIVGGIGPLVLAAILLLTIQESLLFLAVTGRDRPLLRRLLHRLDASLPLGPETVYTVRMPSQAADRGLKQLFTGELAVITPCLWLMYASSLLAMFLLTSWLPLLLENTGLSGPRAAALNGYLHLGATVSSVITALLLARAGVLWLLALLAVGAAACLTLAVLGLAPQLLVAAIFCAGFGILGAQTALNTVAGLLYPVNVRPTGVGAALGIGRIGSIAGPLVGGLCIALGISSQHFFYVLIVPLALVAVGAIVLWVRGADIRRYD